MSAEGLMLGAIAGNLAQARERIAQLEAEIRELKAWAGKNEGLMQAQDRVIEAVSKKVTELEAENAELLGALECSNFSAKRRVEENAELRKDEERLEFVVSCLNEMELFGEFVNRWHPTLRTTMRRGTDEHWRSAIDKARAK